MKKLNNIEDVETLMLKHGENIVDLIGAEIDRIEKGLKVLKGCFSKKQRVTQNAASFFQRVLIYRSMF